jgi:hypothetical protein
MDIQALTIFKHKTLNKKNLRDTLGNASKYITLKKTGILGVDNKSIFY